MKYRNKGKGKSLLRLHEELKTTRELVVPGPRPPDGCMLAADVDSDGNRHVWMNIGEKQSKECRLWELKK